MTFLSPSVIGTLIFSDITNATPCKSKPYSFFLVKELFFPAQGFPEMQGPAMREESWHLSFNSWCRDFPLGTMTSAEGKGERPA